MSILNYATVIDPLLRDMRGFLPDFAGMKAGNSVLDVCCGSGAQVYEYWRRGLLPVGLDGSGDMLTLAEKYYDKNGLPENSFKLADAAHLPFADGVFDFTSISLALHEKDDALVDMILFEMKRVTRAGGGMVFADYHAPLASSAAGYFVRTIEFAAGKRHFSCFRHYLKIGGLPAVLKRSSLSVAKEMLVKGGVVVLVTARN